MVGPTTDDVGSLALAERIRQAIEHPPVQTDAGPMRITASCGVATSDYQHPLAPDAMVRLADEALYRAKARGRNCSELAAVPEMSIADASVTRPEPSR